jgi:hypothetical protein
MRITLDIDEDVLEMAKELAAQRGTTAGRILSALAPGRSLASFCHETMEDGDFDAEIGLT